MSPMTGADGKPQAQRDWLVAVPRGQEQAILLSVCGTSGSLRADQAYVRKNASQRAVLTRRNQSEGYSGEVSQ